MIVKEFIIQNWPLILVLLAFIISLVTTVFLDKKTITRMYILVASVFLLAIVVFIEFYIADRADLKNLRIALMAIRRCPPSSAHACRRRRGRRIPAGTRRRWPPSGPCW